MERREAETIEFKTRVTDSICKTAIAFANGAGGNLYIGIDDFGTVIGVDDIDSEMLRASNMIHDRIQPELLPFVSIEETELDGTPVIRIHVEPGDDKLYYLASKGLVPGGVFTRLGPATVPMDRRTIRRVIRENDGDSFETRHARLQDLTFDAAARFFAARHVDFGEEHYRKLGLYAADGFYSNLALLISDQNPYQIKCAVFNDDAGTEFLNRRECEGSIFAQLEDALTFLSALNNLRSYFPDGMQRVDVRDYPEDAIREGLINAIIHRDYEDSLGTPTLIKMYRTHLDILSYGNLNAITLEEALAQGSSCRNPQLMTLFHRLGIIEAYGSGLPKIFKLYEREGLKPSVQVITLFSLSLPNINTSRNEHLSLVDNAGPSLRGGYDAFEELESQGALPADVARTFARARKRREAELRRGAGTAALQADPQATEMTPRVKITSCTRDTDASDIPSADGMPSVERYLLTFALDHEEGFTRQEAQTALGTGRDTTLKVINGMLESGTLEKTGKARATRYRVAR